MAVELVHGLGERGSRVFHSLVDGRELLYAHEVMALNAGRLADALDRVDAELALRPESTVTNSQGTEVANPLITESRMLTAALSQILAKLGVAKLPEAQPTGRSKVDELADKRAQRRAGVRGSTAADSV